MMNTPTLQIVKTRHGDIYAWPESLDAKLDAVTINASLESTQPPYSPIRVNSSWMLTNGNELHDQKGRIEPESDIGRYLYPKLLEAARQANG